jgi:hypothetical protein
LAETEDEVAQANLREDEHHAGNDQCHYELAVHRCAMGHCRFREPPEAGREQENTNEGNYPDRDGYKHKPTLLILQGDQFFLGVEEHQSQRHCNNGSGYYQLKVKMT